MEHREQLNVVIIGHVDHGKSTLIGRLLADTNSLPEGKLQGVRDFCERNSRVFEYAFLLDALKEEQSQGITIDSARSFFRTKKRDYIIIDCPGHLEFIKNMITGAARANAAIIVIDVKEGIKENSLRHGYLTSMLGIKQVSVAVNKMDLVDYRQEVFESVKKEYSAFLEKVGVRNVSFIPISARNGENIISRSPNLPWYAGPFLLEQMDAFGALKTEEDKPLRFPVQDIYKFTAKGDDRRILAGTVTSGTVREGDAVVFYPSHKHSRVKSIETLGKETSYAHTGQCPGIVLEDQLYIKTGEVMCRPGDLSACRTGRRFKANFFWLGSAPLLMNRDYKIKIGTASIIARVVEILTVIDAADPEGISRKDQLDRLDVAECVFEASRPFAFDLSADFESTGRFVVIDNCHISGCGIILGTQDDGRLSINDYVRDREYSWDTGYVTTEQREMKNRHRAKFVLITGAPDSGKRAIAKSLEKNLFELDYQAYYLGVENVDRGLDKDLENKLEDREEKIRRIGELARIITGSGVIFITVVHDLDDYDLEKIKTLNAPNEILVVNVGSGAFDRFPVDLRLEAGADPGRSALAILRLLKAKNIIEYYL